MLNEAASLMSEEELSRGNDFKRFLRVFLKRKVVLFGVIVILLCIICAVFAPYIAPYDPYEQRTDSVLQGPSREHLLGTDSIGRDVLSRIIYGARISLVVGVGTVVISATVGTILGLLAGYIGGGVYTVVMRFTDMMMALPPVLLALILSAVLGSGLQNVIIAVAVALMPGFIRLVCGQVLSVKENEFVLAARSIGVSKAGIMFKHILPNCYTPLIVQMTMLMGMALLIESTLSFLGVGINPPTAAWGSMVYSGYRYLVTQPIIALAPGFAIMLLVFSLNMVGDGLRDALDPRLKGVL